ncbi:MAG: hypothetical protein JRH20_28625 [Deltaproteobacteria bacterium]|nr:hypothetical protein [Deltaproteobacteria bacterium]
MSVENVSIDFSGEDPLWPYAAASDGVNYLLAARLESSIQFRVITKEGLVADPGNITVGANQLELSSPSLVPLGLGGKYMVSYDYKNSSGEFAATIQTVTLPCDTD